MFCFSHAMPGLAAMIPVMTMPPPTDGTAPHIYEPATTLTGTELVAVPQPKVKRRQKLEPPEGSRLSALFAELPSLEASKKEAEEKLSACKKAIQAEIAAFVVSNGTEMPDQFDIPADPYGAHPAYTLAAREGAWRLDAEAMKSTDPATYARWAKRGQPYWELKRVQKNRVKRG